MVDRRGYLLDVTDRRPNDLLLQELVDILSRYSYNEFYWYCGGQGLAALPCRCGEPGKSALPCRCGEPGVLALPASDGEDAARSGEGRGKTPAAPQRIRLYCEMQGLDLIELGPVEYERLLLDQSNVVVPTLSGKSLCGRIEEMRRVMEEGEVAYRARHAKRLLVTDFSDGYMWHPLCVSLPAIILAGNLMTGGAKAAKMDLEKELCSVMDLPLGGLLQKLGTLYLRGGAMRADSSEFFNILAGDCGYSRHPGLTQYVLDEVSAIARGIRIALERWTDRNDWAKEISYAANLLDCACHRRNEAMLREVRDEHGRIWRARFAPEGRVESLSKLPRF